MNTRHRILVALLITLMVICAQAFFGKSNSMSQTPKSGLKAMTSEAQVN